MELWYFVVLVKEMQVFGLVRGYAKLRRGMMVC